MDDTQNLQHAQAAYATLCQALDDHNWHYEKDLEKMTIRCEAHGDDLPMSILIRVDPNRQLATLYSFLPFNANEDKRLDMAVAVSVINDRLVDGSFDYDIESGRIVFRMTSSFLESVLSKEVFSYMLFCSCQTIDDFNDKLLMLGKGMVDLNKFLEMMPH